MNTRAIINVAVRQRYPLGQWYPLGQDRLKASLEKVGFAGEFIAWRDCYPTGCPPHEVIPDAFKSYAFQEALNRGCTSVIWMDASVWAVQPVEPLFEIIEKEGYLLFAGGGGYVGQWCKDSALPTLRLTREEAMGIRQLYGCVMGIDYTRTANPNSKAWLDEFIAISQDGKTLPGPHPHAKPGEISDDPRVIGHAHEQVVASALAYHHNMQLHDLDILHVCGTNHPRPEAIIAAAGM